MKYSKLMSLIEACGNDVSLYQNANRICITFQDSLGFTADD